jgi:hypothetical protein
MKKFTLTLVAALLFIASPVLAEDYKAYFNGSDILQRCDTEYNPINIYTLTDCLGYIAAVIDLHESLVGAGTSKPFFCKSTSNDLKETYKYVCKFLKENPELLLNSASELVIQVLADLFPCTDS